MNKEEEQLKVNIQGIYIYIYIQVFMKRCHDSSGDYKFPVTANETLSKKRLLFFVVTINRVQTQTKQITEGRPLFSGCAVVIPSHTLQLAFYNENVT